jgi:two-component system chemotaxis sensor kinase CheA
MRSGEDELKEIFLAEAFEQTEELNKLFTELEKNQKNKKCVEAIFRITHTLKANAAGMGFEDIASMAHILEDVFNEIKNGRIVLTLDLFNDLFKANDTLNALISQVKTPGEPVKFRGLKTKLEVLVKNLKTSTDSAIVPAQELKTGASESVKPKAKKKAVAKSKPQKEIESQEEKIRAIKKDIIKIIESAENTQSEITEVGETEDAVKDTDGQKITISENIHIPVRKLDNLLNLVGELIIEKDRVIALSTDQGRGRSNDYARLQRITSELQYSVMDVRLIQVNVLFHKFHRVVRDVAVLENKKVDLVLEGTENEIDRNILQIISDSLVHLVRNSVSHGIESAEERIRKGKQETGTLKLSARSEKDEVIIEIIDDGKGIDPKKIKEKALEKGLISKEMAAIMSEEDFINLIFEPGFSSAEQVTAVSGRGVGMDVVKKALDSIGGVIGVSSEIDKGTTITLKMPSSMAVKGALLFELETGAFAVPLSYTKAVISIPKKDIFQMSNNLLTTHLGKNISLICLNDLFHLTNLKDFLKDGTMLRSFKKMKDDEKVNIIIIQYNNKEVGFVVDRLLQQKEIVEKPLQQPLDNVKFISGATILGNGNICLVLDAASIFNFMFKGVKFQGHKSQLVHS